MIVTRENSASAGSTAMAWVAACCAASDPSVAMSTRSPTMVVGPSIVSIGWFVIPLRYPPGAGGMPGLGRGSIDRHVVHRHEQPGHPQVLQAATQLAPVRLVECRLGDEAEPARPLPGEADDPGFRRRLDRARGDEPARQGRRVLARPAHRRG